MKANSKGKSAPVSREGAEPGDPHSTTCANRTLPLALTLGALGVVYGDIGTSPLYAMRSCFTGPYGIPATHENVLGILSLIFWALALIVSVKYIAFVLRADNRGEGGILALMALAFPERDRANATRAVWLFTIPVVSIQSITARLSSTIC